MYCANCGAEIPENGMFCPLCGHRAAPRPRPEDGAGAEGPRRRAPSVKQISVTAALLLSIVPGLGEIYLGNVWKGIGFFVIAVVLLTIHPIFSILFWAYSVYATDVDAKAMDHIARWQVLGGRQPCLLPDKKPLFVSYRTLIYPQSHHCPMSKSVSKESLAEKTRMYIDAHPSIKDCVSKGLINYSSLARMIMKDICVDNEEAVMIACRRYASKLSVTTDHELSILKILKDSRLEMRTKTCIVTAKNDWSVLHKMDNLFKDLWNENSIMQCVQSASAVTIIADTLLKERIIDTVGRFNLIKVRENLVEIAVKSPEKIVDTSGVIAYLITNLSDAGINIEETVSCHTDTIFIVGESDMINAYSVLTKCIQSAEETIAAEQ